MVEIDQWIVDFAHLFRDSTGLDFDRHVELHNLGWDKIQARRRPPAVSAKQLLHQAGWRRSYTLLCILPLAHSCCSEWAR